MNLKDRRTFRSDAHLTESNPGLCIFNNRDDEFGSVTRKVLPVFPHSQHLPILLTFETRIAFVRYMPLPRWNFLKANWSKYACTLDDMLKTIPATTKNYPTLFNAVTDSARSCVPRGFRKNYIPG